MTLPRSTGPADEPAFSGLFSRSFLTIVLVSLALAWGARQLFSRSRLEPDARSRTVVARGDLAADERATVELFDAASPAVVYIESVGTQRDLFQRQAQDIPEGSGSGFVWDGEGHVVTNYHVVREGQKYLVSFREGPRLQAELVGVAPDFDLAVLRLDVPAQSLHPLPVGKSSDLRVGQKAFAIGYPFGLEQTLTTGVISGLNRHILSQSKLGIHGVIQTDAAINPGNSGGPLLDSAGRLIGINTAIATPTGANSGVGFAVPVDTVNRIVPRILREGMVERAGLGITPGDDYLARDAGLEGAVVRAVDLGTPASRAGLEGAVVTDERGVELRDVIVSIDEQLIRGAEDLYQALEPYRAGDEIVVRVSRVGKGGRRVEEVPVRLAALGRR